MNKNKSFFLIAIALGVFATAIATTHNAVFSLADSEVIYVGEKEIQDRYTLNSILEFKASDKLKCDDKTYDIEECIVKYPSGIDKRSTSFSLNEYGKYSLILNGTDSISYYKSFYVSGDYLVSTNENTKIEYKTLNNQFVSKGYEKGLSIAAVESDFIRFAKPINVYENDITKLIYFNLVQMDQKVKNIDIRLTDCYDPSIYLDILYKRGSKEILTYVALSAQGQRDVGLDQDENGAVKIGDVTYTISPFDGTIMDSNNPVSGNYNNFMFYLDTSDKSRIKVIAETDIVYKKCIISELNNPDIYSYTFPGFTNGNVYLSISANNYEGVDSAKIEIAEACGLTGESLKDLIGSAYNDDNAPIFLSDLDKQVHQIRSGVEFTVPEINVVDDTGIKGTYDYTVWYNYDSNARYMVNVNNGAFLPENLGFYTIIYSATDYFGNVGTYRVDLVASSTGATGISFKFEGFGTMEAGKSYQLNKYQVESLLGDVDVDIYVTDPKGNLTVLEDPTQEFTIKYAGKYNVKYVYKDAFYKGEYETSFVSISTGKPAFDKTSITSSNYYIKGADYSIDPIKAYIYSENEPVLANVKAYVNFDNTSFVECNRAKVNITGNSSLVFKYVANGDESTAIYSEEAKIVDVNFKTMNITLGNYFYSDMFTDKVADEKGMNLTASSAGNGSIDFINKLYFSAFSANFKVSESSKMDKFSVVLTDYYNASNKIEITFTTIDGVSQYVSVNGGHNKYIDMSWKGSEIELTYSSDKSLKLTLSYLVGTKTISYDYELENTKKLTDQYMFLSFDAFNADVNDSVCVETIMKQKFYEYTVADTNSGIASIEFIESVFELNDSFIVPVLYYCDVLSPACELNATVSVNQISDETRVMVAKDGTVLTNVSNFYDNFEIVFDKYGSYQLIYNFIDGVGNKLKSSETGRIRPVVSVLDEVKPEIKLSATTQTAEVGKTITPLSVTVSDNYSKVDDLTIYYFVYNDKGAICASVKQNETFVLNVKGTYTVYVNCLDSSGNTTYVTYQLIVK